MRIIGWNLNHRIRAKPIPRGVVEAIRRQAPDVLVLTEYVDDKSRAEFKQALKDIGLACISVSEKRERHNQVLVASRAEHIVSAVPAPSESHGRTNFLAVSFRDPEFTLVGMRAPAYDSAADVRKYWADLTGILDSISAGKVIVIGDLNGDPNSPRSIGGSHLRGLRDKGWKLPVPKGDWSYISSNGSQSSSVDHVVASPAVGAVSASYLSEIDGVVIAGPKDRDPLSDHAIIQCEVFLEHQPPKEIIVSVAAEGGGVTLYGMRTSKGWLFSRQVRDQTPELLDEPWIEHSSDVVDSWPAALELLDRYPWHRLYPKQVHEAFKKEVLEAVIARYEGTGVGSRSRLPHWKELCSTGSA
jgi:hypothetical protein